MYQNFPPDLDRLAINADVLRYYWHWRFPTVAPRGLPSGVIRRKDPASPPQPRRRDGRGIGRSAMGAATKSSHIGLHPEITHRRPDIVTV